jgi:hypothetical protein
MSKIEIETYRTCLFIIYLFIIYLFIIYLFIKGIDSFLLQFLCRRRFTLYSLSRTTKLGILREYILIK